MPRGIRKERQEMTRTPAGMPTKKLVVNGADPSKKQYWAKPHQFKELQDAGYTFVMNDDVQTGEDRKEHVGSHVTMPASRFNDEKLYLMEIPKEWYEENQRYKQNQITEKERAMFNRGDTETTYQTKDTRKEGHREF